MTRTTAGRTAIGPDWELDFYSRPILDSDGKKRWELLICSTPEVDQNGGAKGDSFQWVQSCPAANVNSIWLREALEQPWPACQEAGFAPPRRLRCWRASMRTMVQRAAEGLGMELVASRRTYALVSWLQQRQREVYPAEEGYMVGPLAPPPAAIRPVPVPLPEAARGNRWSWASLPLAALSGAGQWQCSFQGLVPLPPNLDPQAPCRVCGCSAGRGPWPSPDGWRAWSRCAWRSTGAAGAGGGPGGSLVAGEPGGRGGRGGPGRPLPWPASRPEACSSWPFRQRRATSSFEGFWLLRDLPDA
jgi:hypothetical protein